MQKTVYYCDQCKKIIGDNFHVSLGLNKGMSGVAIPPNLSSGEGELISGRWTIESVPSGFMHFHGICVGPYFVKMIGGAIKRNFGPGFGKSKKSKKTKKDEVRT